MLVKVDQSCPTLCDPMDYTGHRILQDKILKWAALPFSRGSSQPRDWTQVSCIAGGFFTSWATGKPRNTGVGGLSLLQQIFLTQELNLVLLHCRWILHQLRQPRTTLQSGPRACALHLWSTCFLNFFNYHTYLLNIILNFIITVIFPNDCWILWSWKG